MPVTKPRGGARAGAGAPTLPEQVRKRSHLLTFRPEDWDLLRSRAALAGSSVSEYVIHAVKRGIIPPFDVAPAAETRCPLCNTGRCDSAHPQGLCRRCGRTKSATPTR